MDLTELSTLSFDYTSCSSSDDSESLSEVNEDEKEETYEEDGECGSEVAEDMKLENWNKWMRNRKKQQQHLATELNREADKLLMNSEDVYEKKRNQKLIDSAYTYSTFDKYRGDPKFWKIPNYLYGDEEKEVVINCAVQEKFDRTVPNKNEPPVLEYIGIPQLVKYEKGLISKTKENVTVHKCDYLTDRKLELLDNIELIDSCKPDVENLYVQGSAVPYVYSTPASSENNFSLDNPTIVVESVQKPEMEDYSVNKRFPVLKIQGKYVDKSTMKHFNDDFHIFRFLNSMVNELRSETLTIENIGNISVRYSWEQIEPKKDPRIPLRYSSQLGKRIFLLPKRDIILPGQKIQTPILFQSREPGVYCEHWEMVTDPKFAKDNCITLSLRGCVRSKVDHRQSLEIESYIKKCLVTTVSRNLMNASFVNSAVEERIKYNYLITYKDIFLHNNAEHFYDYEKVSALAALHTKVSGDTSWDMSIKSLRNDILGNIKLLNDKRKYLIELYELSNSLLKQKTELNINTEKYNCVYQILCSFANMIDRESQNLREVYGIGESKKSHSTSLETIKEEAISLQRRSSLPTTRKSRSSVLMMKNVRSKHSSLLKMTSSSSFMASLKESHSSVTEVDSKLSLENRNRQYVKTLCIKTYKYLSDVVDEVTAVLESLNMFTLKENRKQ